MEGIKRCPPSPGKGADPLETSLSDQLPYTEQDVYEALENRHGKQAQRRIAQASVAVCGLGGLGSNIAIALARCGIGRLHLIDFDRVDLANLNRQQYRFDQIGQYKTEALADELSRIAPYTEVIWDTVKITEDNASDLLRRDSYICEALDRADQKAMLTNVVLERLPSSILIAGSGMAGYGSSNEIRTRRITRRFYLCGDETSSVEESGTLYAPRVMICAAHQANKVIELIIGES